MVIEPVCGDDAITYNNSCEASCHGTYVHHVGRCGGCNCLGAPSQPICAVNGRTYANVCEANCNGARFAYAGPCNSNARNCNHCSNSWNDPVCGADGRVYQNACFARCNNALVDPYGDCLRARNNANIWHFHWINFELTNGLNFFIFFRFKLTH